MTIDKLSNLIKFAEYNGITTAGELAAYKYDKQIKTNEELYITLYYDALAIKRNVS